MNLQPSREQHSRTRLLAIPAYAVETISCQSAA